MERSSTSSVAEGVTRRGVNQLELITRYYCFIEHVSNVENDLYELFTEFYSYVRVRWNCARKKIDAPDLGAYVVNSR